MNTEHSPLDRDIRSYGMIRKIYIYVCLASLIKKLAVSAWYLIYIDWLCAKNVVGSELLAL